MIRSGKTVVVVGSTLKAGFLALLLDRMLPHSNVSLVAESSVVGGTVQLPILLSAVPEPYREIFDPLIVKTWPGFVVKRATREEHYPAQISLVSGEQLHVELLERFGAERLRFSDRIRRLDTQTIEFASGDSISAHEVIDVRQYIGPQPSGILTPRYAMTVRDLDYEAPHEITDPILYSEIERCSDGIVFAQYLPLTETMVRETVYRPSSWTNAAPSQPATVTRMEKFTVDANDVFDRSLGTEFSAETIDFATMLDGGIGDLLAKANRIATRQIRIVA